MARSLYSADDIQEGFLLAGERGIRQVFGSGRGAHGEGHVGGRVGDQALVLLGDGHSQRHRERRFHDRLTDLGATGGQRIHILDIERIEHGVDLRIQTALRQKVAIRLGRGGKAAGHANAGAGQLADHFAQ